MKKPSTVEFLSTPIERHLDTVGECPFITLLGAGIKNPMGPTLTTLVVEGFFPFQPGSIVTFLQIMLNPFSQWAREVAIARVDEDWSPFEELPRFFSLDFGCCPTLLLPSAFFKHEINVNIYSYFLPSFSDGPTTAKAAEVSGELLKPEKVKEELEQLTFFWEGSIRCLKKRGASDMAESAMPLQEFAKFLRLFALTCKLPETGPIVTEMAILAGLVS